MASWLEMKQVELLPASTVAIDAMQWKPVWPKLQLTEVLKHFEDRHFCGDTLRPAHTAGHCPKKYESQGTGNSGTVGRKPA